MIRGVVLFLCVIIAGAAISVLPDEVLDDPELEARARALSAELRCVICQGESIDGSGAAIARDVRVLLREMLVEGKSEDEIKDFLSARYGDTILLRPRFSGSGVLLWLIGPILFVFGGLISVIFIRRSGRIEFDEDGEND